jgi:hypothetical protein
MNIRTAVVCTLGLAAATFAQAGHAHGISIDETITCASVVTSSGTPDVFLTDTTPTTNYVTSGVNFPVLVCADSVTGDQNLTARISAASLTGPANNPNTPPLSNFSSLNVSIIAQASVFRLAGAYSGDYEIIFNYETFNEVACDNVYTKIAPTFKWHGKIYSFTGGGGVTTPCDSAATNDFLFGANGVLLGYNSAPDGSGFSLTAGLPPGWTVK